jgi:hypothetical protein
MHTCSRNKHFSLESQATSRRIDRESHDIRALEVTDKHTIAELEFILSQMTPLATEHSDLHSAIMKTRLIHSPKEHKLNISRIPWDFCKP